MLFYYGRRQIQRGRTNPSQQMTLVSLIVAAICGLVEVLQGLQTLSACLHHADVNEQVCVLFLSRTLCQFKQLKEFERLRGLGLRHPEIYGSLLDLWSPTSLDRFGNNIGINAHGHCLHDTIDECKFISFHMYQITRVLPWGI